jgi:hypothetical protein
MLLIICPLSEGNERKVVETSVVSSESASPVLLRNFECSDISRRGLIAGGWHE